MLVLVIKISLYQGFAVFLLDQNTFGEVFPAHGALGQVVCGEPGLDAVFVLAVPAVELDLLAQRVLADGAVLLEADARVAQLALHLAVDVAFDQTLLPLGPALLQAVGHDDPPDGQTHGADQQVEHQVRPDDPPPVRVQLQGGLPLVTVVLDQEHHVAHQQA
eukprot:CAMPEP_0116948146 /NCGR_PEP_ID=MMETSP0467-20121206/38133_1 /TAXON_ID=283647 /ORGANISM="Mesodinium pulex, Strain SPMC105" /LENGTH=161 /DNA_ID=CAMNT_0004632511 /DNA_START=125 /DNA_END=610 /DNA_ORIENTATION=-